jgi:hypothetical protein
VPGWEGAETAGKSRTPKVHRGMFSSKKRKKPSFFAKLGRKEKKRKLLVCFDMTTDLALELLDRADDIG